MTNLPKEFEVIDMLDVARTSLGIGLVKQTCPGGGVGRHRGLKIPFSQGSGGSNPPSGTI